ncbi:hypothetical protein TNCV_2326461 [Trichonephila clavipes]|nr:hypothetical protein TNCV_2326461 [Trichonephila clavipes]
MLICRELKRPPVGEVWKLGERGTSGVVHLNCPWLKITWSVAKRPRVAEQCDVNIQSINHFIIAEFYELQTKEKQTKLCNSQGKQ